MPRGARILVDGGTYHVITRGNNGQPVFHGNPDFQHYLQLLSGYLEEYRLKLYHFVLMPNHVHLVLEVDLGKALSKAMLGLNLSYTWYYRKRYRYTGHLWQGRFKSLLIDRDSYLLECGRYVELNPVRAGLATSPDRYAWSSFRAYAEGVEYSFLALAHHPLYVTLGASSREQQERYRQFVLDGLRMTTPFGPSPGRLDGRILPAPGISIEKRLGIPIRRQQQPAPTDHER